MLKVKNKKYQNIITKLLIVISFVLLPLPSLAEMNCTAVDDCDSDSHFVTDDDKCAGISTSQECCCKSSELITNNYTAYTAIGISETCSGYSLLTTVAFNTCDVLTASQKCCATKAGVTSITDDYETCSWRKKIEKNGNLNTPCTAANEVGRYEDTCVNYYSLPKPAGYINNDGEMTYECCCCPKGQTCTAEDATEKKPFILISPLENLQIKIPGLDKLAEQHTATCTDNGATTQCTLPWIAIYIKAIFNYSMGALGILAAIALMIGGVTWIVAGGNASRITTSKSWISASITGLIIGVTSYILLNEVNPSLTSLKPIQLKAVREEIVLMDSDSYEAYTGEAITAAFSKEMVDAIKEIGQEYDVSPCWYVANFKFESGGQVNAIGPDVNVTVNNSTTYKNGFCAIISRRKFLYREGVITKDQAFYKGAGYGCNASTKTLEFDKNQPDLLDPEYSWGLGLSQYTIFPDASHDKEGFFGLHTEYCTTGGKRGFKLNGKCIGIAEALTLKGNIKIISSVTKSYYCPGIKYDGSGFDSSCFSRYGNLDTSFKTALYNQCLQDGIDSYVE